LSADNKKISWIEEYHNVLDIEEEITIFSYAAKTADDPVVMTFLSSYSANELTFPHRLFKFMSSKRGVHLVEQELIHSTSIYPQLIDICIRFFDLPPPLQNSEIAVAKPFAICRE
jgi:hypothetical protein